MKSKKAGEREGVGVSREEPGAWGNFYLRSGFDVPRCHCPSHRPRRLFFPFFGPCVAPCLAHREIDLDLFSAKWKTLFHLLSPAGDAMLLTCWGRHVPRRLRVHGGHDQELTRPPCRFARAQSRPQPSENRCGDVACPHDRNFACSGQLLTLTPRGARILGRTWFPP